MATRTTIGFLLTRGTSQESFTAGDPNYLWSMPYEEVDRCTVKILKFGTPETIAIIVLKIEKFDVTLH